MKELFIIHKNNILYCHRTFLLQRITKEGARGFPNAKFVLFKKYFLYASLYGKSVNPVYCYVEITILYFNKLWEIDTNISEKNTSTKKTTKLLIENILCRVNYTDSKGDVNNSSTPEAPLLSELNDREDADVGRGNNTDGAGRLSSSTIHTEGYKIYYIRRYHNLFEYVILPF
mgnify:CR=1 FL=1